MINNFQNVVDEVNNRLLIAVNGKLPKIVESELSQVLADLNLTLILKSGEVSSSDVNQFNDILNSFSTLDEDISLNTYAFLKHLSSLGWVIIPPR